MNSYKETVLVFEDRNRRLCISFNNAFALIHFNNACGFGTVIGYFENPSTFCYCSFSCFLAESALPVKPILFDLDVTKESIASYAGKAE